MQGKPGEGGRLEAKGRRCFREREWSNVLNDDHMMRQMNLESWLCDGKCSDFNKNFLTGVVGHSLTGGCSRAYWKTGMGLAYRDNSSGAGGGVVPV